MEDTDAERAVGKHLSSHIPRSLVSIMSSLRHRLLVARSGTLATEGLRRQENSQEWIPPMQKQETKFPQASPLVIFAEFRSSRDGQRSGEAYASRRYTTLPKIVTSCRCLSVWKDLGVRIRQHLTVFTLARCGLCISGVRENEEGKTSIRTA
jgi:hypothetical protein